MLNKIRKKISRYLAPQKKETAPAAAYDMWALQYDAQPDNLMLALDEEMFSALLEKVELHDKVVADVGCGTGRHWKKIFDRQPRQLIGYDVSEGMLQKLKEKYPQAVTHQLSSNHLEGLENGSCDVIMSTLAIAHIENIEDALKEWDRVLKSGGDIMLTDYHPQNLQQGGDRTFVHEGKLIAVKSYVHTFELLREIAEQLDWEILSFSERAIDETMKHWYEHKNALHVYEKYKGCPIIYSMHIKKK